MADVHTPEQRSFNMSRIRGANTKPEILLRSLLHRAGFRFRKNLRSLPGTPDIVLPKFQTVIFVHGCFWHRHEGCRFATTPKSNEAFWKAKFAATVQRDRLNEERLEAAGWKVIIVWECKIKSDPKGVLERLRGELQNGISAHTC